MDNPVSTTAKHELRVQTRFRQKERSRHGGFLREVVSHGPKDIPLQDLCLVEPDHVLLPPPAISPLLDHIWEKGFHVWVGDSDGKPRTREMGLAGR